MTKDAFDTFREWANKPLDSLLTIDADLHHAVTSMPREDWDNRERVNRAAENIDKSH